MIFELTPPLPPFNPTYILVCACALCNAAIQKRSAKGSHFKEDDRGFAPLEVIILYGTVAV